MEQTILMIISISILLLCVGVILYILYENRHFHVTTYEYSNKKIPKAFDQSVILFISDLHNYTYGTDNEKLLKVIRNNSPDYILIGGDMIVKGTEFDGTKALQLIKKLTREYPVYYAFGNHELRSSMLPETKNTTFLEYIRKLKKYGVKFLLDDKITLTKKGDSIELYGLNLPAKYFEKFKRTSLPEEELLERLGKPDKSRFSLLLAHNPIYFKDYTDWGADLVLSGHVHGGMIVLPALGGVMSTQGLLFPKYDFGLFKDRQATMILSRGLGNHTIHIRINNRAELVKIVLQSN